MDDAKKILNSPQFKKNNLISYPKTQTKIKKKMLNLVIQGKNNY